MNPLAQLPSLIADHKGEEADAEFQAKADRIRFHRDHVRNGPVNFKGGRGARSAERLHSRKTLHRSSKRARKAQVKNYFGQQREYAALRGNLQLIGLVPFVLRSSKPSAERVERAYRWLVQTYAQVPAGERVEVTSEVVVGALTAAYNRYQTLTGQEVTSLPPAYTLG